MFRVGQGYDIHQLVVGRNLILGGVTIPFAKGLLGHSDADALLHAIIDALLGAATLGDIGGLFPDTATEFKNANSRVLLREAYFQVQNKGYTLVNIDATIIAQAPKLASFITPMRQNIATDLHIWLDCVNIKGKTNEKMGYLGREEAIEAQAIVLLRKL